MDRSKPATHSLTLHMTVNDPVIWQNKYDLLEATAKKSAPHCNYVSVSSSLLGADEESRDDLELAQQVLSTISRYMSPEKAWQVLNAIIDSDIRFREKD